jgi:hypothetical protein
MSQSKVKVESDHPSRVALELLWEVQNLNEEDKGRALDLYAECLIAAKGLRS